MGFAQSDRSVDVKRIEHQRLAAPTSGDLFGCGVRQRVRTSDNEGLKAQPRIERRTAKRFVHVHEGNAGARAGSGGSIAFGFAVGNRIVEERTVNSRRVTSGSSDCHLSSTFSL